MKFSRAALVKTSKANYELKIYGIDLNTSAAAVFEKQGTAVRTSAINNVDMSHLTRPRDLRMRRSVFEFSHPILCAVAVTLIRFRNYKVLKRAYYGLHTRRPAVLKIYKYFLLEKSL